LTALSAVAPVSEGSGSYDCRGLPQSGTVVVDDEVGDGVGVTVGSGVTA
jgi:hypothetical protein